MSCSSHSGCLTGQYCDSAYNCYTCSHITPSVCDAFDANCCSEAFLAQCTDDPAQCQLPPDLEGRAFVGFPTAFRVPLGVIGLIAGLLISATGYRLWKYTIFFLGFVIFAVPGAVIGWYSQGATNLAKLTTTSGRLTASQSI